MKAKDFIGATRYESPETSTFLLMSEGVLCQSTDDDTVGGFDYFEFENDDIF